MGFDPRPPFLKEQRVWYAAAAGAAAIGIALVAWGVIPRDGWWPLLLLPVVLAIAYMIGRPYLTLSRRLRRGELPCWECGYNLSATGETGKCPECGQAYVEEGLRKWWADAERKGSRPLNRWPFDRLYDDR